MHADSVGFAVAEAKRLRKGLPEPLQALDDDAKAYWPIVVNAKRLTAWTESDLALAAGLACDLAAIDALRQQLADEGNTLKDNRGKLYAHPAANLLDQATRRTIASARALQINAVATTGKSDHQGGKNEAARKLKDQLNGASDLIKRIK